MAEVYKLQHLTGKKLEVFRALADRIVPADNDSPGAGGMASMGIADWAMGRMDPSLRSQFLLFLMVVQYLGFFFGGRTFTKNSEAAKDRELKFLENAPLGLFRMGFFGLKTYACMGYYVQEDSWKTIKYEGPLVPDRPFPDQVIRDLCQGRLEVVP